jgi:hypothetical protein
MVFEWLFFKVVCPAKERFWLVKWALKKPAGETPTGLFKRVIQIVEVQYPGF